MFAGVPRLLGNGSPFALGRDTSPAFTFAMYVCGDAGTGGLASIGDQFPGATVGLCMPHKHFELNTKGPLAGSVFHNKSKKETKAAKKKNKQWLKMQLARFFACSSRDMYKQRQKLLQQSVLTSAGAFGQKVNAGVVAILEHLSSWHKHPDYFHNASGIPTVNANNMPLENWHQKVKHSKQVGKTRVGLAEFHNTTFPSITDVTKQQHCSPIARYADITTNGPTIGCVRKAANYFSQTKQEGGCSDLHFAAGKKTKGPWYFNSTEHAGQALGAPQAAAHELALKGEAKVDSLAEFDRVALGIHKAETADGGPIKCSCIGYWKISFCSHSLLCGEISRVHRYLAKFEDPAPVFSPSVGRPTNAKKGAVCQDSPNKNGPAGAADAAPFLTDCGLLMAGQPAKRTAAETKKPERSSSGRTLTPKKQFDPAVEAAKPQWKTNKKTTAHNRKRELFW